MGSAPASANFRRTLRTWLSMVRSVTILSYVYAAAHQLVPREHLARMAQERPNDPEFRDGEHHRFSVPMGLEPIKVQFQVAMPQDLFRIGLLLGLACEGLMLSALLSTAFTLCHQLPGAERLGNVVIPAQFQADDAIDLFVAEMRER